MKETIKKTVEEMLQKRGYSDFTVELKEIEKNNGIKKTGILIQAKEDAMHPLIYINDLIPKHNSFRSIAEEIIEAYEKSKKQVQNVWSLLKFDKDSVLDNAILKVINRERNAKLLESVPHREYLDLASVCLYKKDFSECESGTILIDKDMIKVLNITEDELFEAATKNTFEQIKICQDSTGILHVLTNNSVTFGASAILFNDVLKELADKFGEDFYIFPSSIHEIMAIEKSKQVLTVDEMNEMVKEINGYTEIVDNTEILSDNVYVFSRETGEVSIA